MRENAKLSKITGSHNEPEAFDETGPETLISPPIAPPPSPPEEEGDVIGKLEVPRLGMSYVMLEGTEDRTLDRSIGRIHGTGVLGKAGNIAIAGHRNTQFCKLEWFERGDKVILTSPHGRFRNEVEWALVSEPDHLEVLDSSHGPASTLVTCFPFDYVVAAPLRYFVRALPDEETESQLLPLPLPSPESNPIKASQ